MKKVLIISSSLRHNSNSELIADEFAKGAVQAGHEVEKVSLKGKNIAFCKGCLSCIKTGSCFIKDDAIEITEKMKNAEVIAFAKQNPGYTVGIPSLGSQDTIAPAVSQGNTTVLDWLNEEIKALGEENFFHKDYEETLVDTYGLDYEDELVVEGGETNA